MSKSFIIYISLTDIILKWSSVVSVVENYIGNCKEKTVCLRGVDDAVMVPPCRETI